MTKCTFARVLSLLAILSVDLACDQDVETILVARCTDDAQCTNGDVCVDGECVPRDALSCTKVDDGQALLQPGPPLVDFGFVGSGTARRELDVQNIGDCTLTVFDAYLANEAGSPFQCPMCAPERFPFELFPFRKRPFEVFFTPPEVGEFADELILLSDDAELSEIRVPLRARFDGIPVVGAAPSTLDFDFVPVGQVVTRTLEITNQGTGRAPLRITGLTIDTASASSAAFSFEPALDAPLELTPARTSFQVHEISITYRPTDMADHAASLVLTTNAPGEAVVRVPLRGTSRNPARIMVSPDRLNFGPVPVGMSTSLPLTLINEGGAPLRITPRWGGTGRSTDLSVSPQVIPPIAPGQLFELAVQATATGPGPFTGLLILDTNDPASPSVVVPVAAEGQEVLGATVLKVEMNFDNGSDSALDDDFRDVDMTLENPFGRICNERNPDPMDWGAFGRPSWLSFGPKEEPERIILTDAMQDGTYRVLLSYQEDCASVPTALVAAVLGISIETLINALIGAPGVGPGAGAISDVIDSLCLSRASTAVTVNIFQNGELIGEKPVRLQRKGELIYAVDIIRANGAFTVSP
ncbi:MAG: choice-of-anchor D domain-containing protein [Myxococcota bacterium]